MIHVVTLIAVKREVAAETAGFPWSECQLENWRQVTVQVKKVHRKNGMPRVILGHTRGCVQSPLVVLEKCEKEATFLAASQVMRITLKAYDHQLVDASASKIIETVKRMEQ